MDLRLYFRVIWRFRIVVAIGLVFAIFMAVLSFVRISPGSPHVSYRQSQDWRSSTVFTLSGPGFAVGSTRGAGGSNSSVQLAALAAYYAPLALGDDVRRLMLKDGPIRGVIDAQPAVNNLSAFKTPLPILTITADATSQEAAVTLAQRAARAFTTYVVQQQQRFAIPPSQRIQFNVLNAAKKAELVGPRKKTLPIVIFLTIMTAAIGLAFVLENLRPRVRPVSTLEDEDITSRRSA